MPTREHSLDNPIVDGRAPLTQREVAILLGVSPKRVRELVDEGKLEERTNGRHPTGAPKVEYNAVQVARLAVWRKLKIASLEREKRIGERVDGEKAQPLAVDAEDTIYQRYFEQLGQSTRRHERFMRDHHRHARTRASEGQSVHQRSTQPKDQP
jgi:hypothetical protein